jgi:hypothetical protein
VDETGVPGENYRPDASHWQTLSYKVLSYSNETIIDITERKSMLAEPMYWTEEMCCCKTPLSGLR